MFDLAEEMTRNFPIRNVRDQEHHRYADPFICGADGNPLNLVEIGVGNERCVCSRLMKIHW